MFLAGINIKSLVFRFRCDGFPRGHDVNLVFMEIFHIPLCMGQVLNGMIDVCWIYRETFPYDSVKFGDYPVCILKIFFVAYDGKMVPAYTRSNVEVFFEIFYVFVTWAKKVSSYVGVIKG